MRENMREKMNKINVGALITALLIPLAVGEIAYLLSMKGITAYASMNKPPLAPPAWLFPVAWTILYLMMGLATYFAFTSENNITGKARAIVMYALQLAMNFMWTIIFFNWGYYLFAFIWLIIMWAVVICCALQYWKIERLAGYLMIPYILWLTFAAYLNMGTYILNKV